MSWRRRVLAVFSAAAVTTAGNANTQAPPTPLAEAVAEVEKATAARTSGDEAAWKLVLPEFMFVHATGQVDDLATYRASRRGPAPPGRGEPGPLTPLEPPIDRLVGDVLVRSQLLQEPGQPSRVRTMNVYVKREGRWHWLAFQGTLVEPVRKAVALERALLDEYAGAYAAADGRKRSYARRDDVLVESSEGPRGATDRRLIALSDATFGYEGFVPTLTFVRDKAGRVVAADVSTPMGFTRYSRAAP